MLPLVRGIVGDIIEKQQALTRLAPEQEFLDEVRRSLDWTGRQRRYALQDEITKSEKALTEAVSELTALGVRLIDAAVGSVDFPTRINGRSAAFSWQPGDESVTFWHYAGEELRRPIPADWQSGTPLRTRTQP